MRVVAVLGVLACGFIVAIPATDNGEEQVHVVKVESQQQKEFDSPMVLELPLDEYWAYSRDATWATRALRDYSCEGVTLDELRLVDKNDRDGRHERTVVIVEMVNRGSQDKKVDVDFDLVRGDQLVASAHIKGQSVEEDDDNTEKAKFPISLRDLGPGSGAMLKITVRAEDD